MAQDNETNKPYCAIRFSLKWNELHIHKSAVELLNRPKYIQFLISREKNMLYMVGCAKKEKDCFAVPPNLFVKPKMKFHLHSKLFTELIRQQMGWKANATYLIAGKYSSEMDMIVFPLMEATMTWESK